MTELVDVPLFDLEPAAPPVPETGDLEGLRRYLAAMPEPQPRPKGTPRLNIGMPERIGGLTEEARTALVAALRRMAHQLDTGPQDWLTPRMLAGWLMAVAGDIQFDMDRLFNRRGITREERLADREAAA